jgi:hypothetical protein
LQRNPCHYLVVTRRVRREADLGARDVVMIVKNADAALATIAVRSEIVIPSTRHRKIVGGLGETFGDVGERRSNLCDIECGIEVAAQDLKVKIGIVIATGNFADEEEIGFTQAGGKLLDRAAQIPATLLIDVFQGIDPKSVTVGERNPVFVTAGDIIENTGLVVINIAITDKVGASKLGMGIVDIAGAEVTLTGSRVGIIRP